MLSDNNIKGAAKMLTKEAITAQLAADKERIRTRSHYAIGTFAMFIIMTSIAAWGFGHISFWRLVEMAFMLLMVFVLFWVVTLGEIKKQEPDTK